MTSFKITQPAPNGDHASVVIDGIEVNRSIRSLSVNMEPDSLPRVTVDLLVHEVFEIGAKDGILVIDSSTADLLERHGWTAPAAVKA